VKELWVSLYWLGKIAENEEALKCIVDKEWKVDEDISYQQELYGLWVALQHSYCQFVELLSYEKLEEDNEVVFFSHRRFCFNLDLGDGVEHCKAKSNPEGLAEAVLEPL